METSFNRGDVSDDEDDDEAMEELQKLFDDYERENTSSSVDDAISYMPAHVERLNNRRVSNKASTCGGESGLNNCARFVGSSGTEDVDDSIVADGGTNTERAALSAHDYDAEILMRRQSRISGDSSSCATS